MNINDHEGTYCHPKSMTKLTNWWFSLLSHYNSGEWSCESDNCCASPSPNAWTQLCEHYLCPTPPGKSEHLGPPPPLTYCKILEQPLNQWQIWQQTQNLKQQINEWLVTQLIFDISIIKLFWYKLKCLSLNFHLRGGEKSDITFSFDYGLPNIVQELFCTLDWAMDPTFQLKYIPSGFVFNISKIKDLDP